MAYSSQKDFQLNTLVKKNLGYAITSTSLDPNQELVGSATARIFSNNIYSQEVPSDATQAGIIKNGLINFTTGFTTTLPDPASNNSLNTYVLGLAGAPVSADRGRKQIGSAPYSYIAKYSFVSLYPAIAGKAYRFNQTDTAVNLLSGAIPSNREPISDTYSIKVYIPTLANWANSPVLPNDAIYPYYFDVDSGYLTFINGNCPTTSNGNVVNPLITFWRYEGTTGVGSGSGSGSTNYGALDSSNNNWTGINKFITPDISNNSDQVATTKFIYNVLGTTPELINSINNLNQAVIDSSDNLMSALVATYAPKNSPILTGLPLAPTPLSDASGVQIATVDYVKNAISGGGSVDGSGVIIINHTLRDAPDAPGIPSVNYAVSTSTYILLKFTPNSQYNWGFTDVPLPRINTFSAQYDKNVSNVSTLTDLLPPSSQKTTYTNPTTINACGFIRTNPSDTVVSGICLVKAFPTTINGVTISGNGINQITDASDSRYYYCTSVPQTDLFPDDVNGNGTNKLHIWYSNYYPSTNKRDLTFKIYISSGPPSDPQYFVKTTSTTPNDTSSIWTTGTAWNDPSNNDSSNPTSTVGLSSYQVSFWVDPSNVPVDPSWNAHYPSYNSTSSNPLTVTVNAIGNNPPAKIASLSVYPSTSYIAYVKAKNTDNANYGAQSNTLYFKTSDLSPAITTIVPSPITFTTTGWTARTSVKDLTNTNQNIFMSTSNPTTNTITTPIQNSTALIASSLSGIRNIVSKLTNNSPTPVVIADSSSTPLSYGGFGRSAPSAVTGDLALTNSSISDQFNLDGQMWYYQKAQFTGTINATRLVASPYTYTYQMNDATISAVGNTSISFYYEPVQSSPVSATGITYTTPSLSEVTLWGLKIVNSDITLNTTISGIANIGQYFYSSSNFITYSSSTSSSLSTFNNSANKLTNLPSGAIDTGVTPNKIKSSFDVTNNVTYPVPTVYTQSHSVSAEINGIISGRSITVTSTNFSALCDPLTRTFYGTLTTDASTIPSLYGSLSPGRILAPLQSSDTPFVGALGAYSSGNKSLADQANFYNFGNSLTTSPYNYALLFSNGGFVTPNTYLSSNSLYPYKNYNGIGGNTLDYSYPASFGNETRCVMMAWKIPDYSGSNITNYSFTKINVSLDFTETTITKVDNYTVNLNNIADSLQVSYRFEDADDSINPTSGAFNANYKSSIWIRGNSNGPSSSQATNLNVFNTSNDLCGVSSPPVVSGQNISLTLIMPTLTTPNKDIKFMLRICIPATVQMKMTNIRAKML